MAGNQKIGDYVAIFLSIDDFQTSIPCLPIINHQEQLMENEWKNLDIDNLSLPSLVEELRRAANRCSCEGTRERVFTSRGRDNLVPCLECEPIYQVLEPLEMALEIFKEARR
jgi:hypothetical protein